MAFRRQGFGDIVRLANIGHWEGMWLVLAKGRSVVSGGMGKECSHCWQRGEMLSATKGRGALGLEREEECG